MRAKCAVASLLLLLISAAMAAGDAAAESPPRLRPDGIAGTVFLMNSDSLPESVSKRFVQAAGGDEAKLVIIVGDSERTAAKAEKAFLALWEELKPDKVEFVHITTREQADDEKTAALIHGANGVWMTGIDGAKFLAATRGTRFAAELPRLLDRKGAIGIQGTACGLLATGTISDETSANVGIGWNLLSDCVVNPFYSDTTGDKRLHEIIVKTPGQIGIGLPKDTTLVLRGRDLFTIDGGSAFVLLPRGKNWHAESVVLRDHRAGDWNQLHRAARDRANLNYLPSEPAAPDVPHGALVIIGGGGTPAAVLKKFIELAGGKDANFVVFPTAMPDPIVTSAESNFLRRAGVKNVAVLPAREQPDVDSAENLDVLKKANAIWFGGGRQWRFVDAYEGTKAAQLVREVLERGGVVGGSSAGATIQGDYLVRGSPFGSDVMMCEGYERGLALLPGVAIDQHFTVRNRFADMTGLMKKYPQFLGIGIDESTALIVQGHTAEIMGKGKVHFYDRHKTAEPDKPDYEAAAAGDKYDFQERQVIRAEKKPEAAAKPDSAAK